MRMITNWGFTISTMNCGPGHYSLYEIWDPKIQRVFDSKAISDVAIYTGVLDGYKMVWDTVFAGIADAIFNRALWRKYGKMPHELTDSEKDNVFEDHPEQKDNKWLTD